MQGMRVPFYDIKAQYLELASEIDPVVHEVVSSGVYAMGPHHNALEREVADLHGMKHGIALNSGTDALRISLEAAGIQPGDEVITTAFTFVASVETIVQVGATPVFVDINPTTFDIDADQLEAAITPRTKAIMPVHLFGQLADVERVGKIAADHGLIILEDAAQAIATKSNLGYAGKFGLAASFSFYVTKNLGAAGDAGMILTDDDEVAAICRSMRVHGMGRERYYYDYVGYTSRMDEIQAAILRVKLRHLEEWNQRREAITAVYQAELVGPALPVVRPGNIHTWHQYTIRTTQRDALQAFLKTQGIDSMIYYPVPIHFHSPYEKFGKGKGSLPVTEATAREVLNLPVHPHLAIDQAKWVTTCVNQFFARSE